MGDLRATRLLVLFRGEGQLNGLKKQDGNSGHPAFLYLNICITFS